MCVSNRGCAWYEGESMSSSNDAGFIRIGRSRVCEGLGAFAKTALRKELVVGEYKGVWCLMSESEIKASHSRYLARPNMMYNDDNEVWIVDASDISKSNWTRYINSSLSAGEANVELVSDSSKIRVVTLRCIEENEELLLFYGEDWVNDFVSQKSQ